MPATDDVIARNVDQVIALVEELVRRDDQAGAALLNAAIEDINGRLGNLTTALAMVDIGLVDLDADDLEASVAYVIEALGLAGGDL